MTTEQQQEETDIFKPHQVDYTEHCGVLQVGEKELNIYRTTEGFWGNKYKWDFSDSIAIKIKKEKLNSKDQWLNENIKGTFEEKFWKEFDEYIQMRNTDDVVCGVYYFHGGFWEIGDSETKYSQIRVWLNNKGDVIEIPLYYNGVVRSVKFPRKHLSLVMKLFSIREVTEENMYEFHGHHKKIYISYGQQAVSIYDERLDGLWKQGILKLKKEFLDMSFNDETFIQNHFYIKDEIKHIVDQYISFKEEFKVK